jgi:predicted DNA-binding transcriptional regulator AlpA
MDRLMTPKQIATLLSIHEQSLQRMRTQGTGPVFIQVGGAIRYQMSAVQEWLEQNTARTTQPNNRGRRTGIQPVGEHA